MSDKTEFRKEILKYIKWLDEIDCFLDDLDETAGIPFDVADSIETLNKFFAELSFLNR